MGTQMLERKETDFFIDKNNGEGNNIRSPEKGKFAPATSPTLFKKCKKCQRVKPIVEFHRYKQGKDGLQLYCIKCRKEYRKKYFIRKPWEKTLIRILSRCNDKNRWHHKKGIKNFLKTADLKYLYFRDKAYLMKKSSIDRKNPDEHYTLENCRFIELVENVKRKKLERRR